MQLNSQNYTISGYANDSSSVIVTDSCGQSGSIPFIITVCDTEAINIFTPNDDGINEGFIIKGIESFPNSQLQVYNRWGTLVFESPNYSNQNPWDGKNVEDGVYYWILIRSDGVEPSPSGYVHVIHD
jgi:gliding motility-associated-like protein